MPLWLGAAVADWHRHRQTRIETSAGPRAAERRTGEWRRLDGLIAPRPGRPGLARRVRALGLAGFWNEAGTPDAFAALDPPETEGVGSGKQPTEAAPSSAPTAAGLRTNCGPPPTQCCGDA
jgi:hypothetical protein